MCVCICSCFLFLVLDFCTEFWTQVLKSFSRLQYSQIQSKTLIFNLLINEMYMKMTLYIIWFVVVLESLSPESIVYDFWIIKDFVANHATFSEGSLSCKKNLRKFTTKKKHVMNVFFKLPKLSYFFACSGRLLWSVLSGTIFNTFFHYFSLCLFYIVSKT